MLVLGYVKNKAFRVSLHDIQQLKTIKTDLITDVTVPTLKKVATIVLKTLA